MSRSIRIGIIGDFESERQSHKATNDALNAIQFAREKNYPFIGTCGGFQYTVIEYARNQLGLNDVQHAEYNPDANNFIITPLSCSLVGETCKILINKNSRIYMFYNETEVEERFSCNFGLNPNYRDLIDISGLKVVGTDENDEVRILDLKKNIFFIATLFQPQLNSLPSKPHKLILAYLTCLTFTARSLPPLSFLAHEVRAKVGDELQSSKIHHKHYYIYHRYYLIYHNKYAII